MKLITNLSNKYLLRRIVVFSLVCCMFFNTSLQLALAGPEGAQVVNGQVTFQQNGYNTTITASDQSIINYSSFDIAQPEVVQFIQPSSSASVLNRILSANPTMINGTLLANGRVFFVNPAGVIIGGSARINVTQLVASGLNMSNSSFLNGQYEFAGGNGSVINEGDISAQSVYLVGKQVINAGNIQCPDGYVVMAAGDKVYLGEPGSNIIVEIGSIEAPDVDQTQFSAEVINEGIIDAGGGTIILAAAGDILSRPIVSNFGSLSTSVSEGDAGNISLVANEGQIINTGDITAISNNGSGGTVTANADEIVNTGTVNVSGAQGGNVDFEGTSFVGQFGSIYADGLETDGGNISLAANQEVALGSQSLTTANAGTNGKGGEVIAYSPMFASFEEGAVIQARGGSESGDGGFFELSGLEGAMVGGFADLRAPAGLAGTFLLDPHSVTISDADNSYYNVNVAWLETQLGLVNMTVDTSGRGYGDIIVVDPVGSGGAWSSSNWLKLDADDDIFVNAGITCSGNGDLWLIANYDIKVASTSGGINLNGGHLAMLGGQARGDSVIQINANITAGSMDIEAGDPGISNSGNVNLNVADGVTLRTTSGDLIAASAREHVTILGDVIAEAGSIYLTADSDNLGRGDLTTKNVSAENGSIELKGREVTVNGSAQAGGDLTIRAMSDIGYGGGIVHSTDNLQAGGYLDISVRRSLTNDIVDGSGQITLDGDAIAGADVILRNNTDMTTADSLIQAGDDIILTDKCETLTGNTKLTIDALGGQIIQGSTKITVSGSELIFKQFDDLDMTGRSFGNKALTDVTLQSYGGYVKDLAADEWATVNATANNGTNNSNNAIELAAASDLIAKQLLAENDNINISTTGSGDIIVDEITAADDKITINSAGAIREYDADTKSDLTAYELDLDAVAGIYGLSPIETSATTIDADVSGDGNIEIDNTGGTAISADIVGNGNIDIDNSSGAATTASSLTVGGTGYILFDQSGGGALEVTLATTQAGNIGIDVAGASLTATQVHATDGSVDFDADGLLTAVDVQANDSASTGDYDVTLDTTAGGMDLQFVQADHDIIAEALAGNIEVDSLIAGNQISLTANTVSGQKITDDDDNSDLDAPTVVLTAKSGIGSSAHRIETDTDKLTAQVTEAGDLYITEADGVELVDVDVTEGTLDIETLGAGLVTATAVDNAKGLVKINSAGALTATHVYATDGSVDLDADGEMRAIDVMAGGDGNVDLKTTSGDILVDTVTAADDKIAIDSAGAIREYDADTESDLTAYELDLDAVAGIYGLSPIETSATTIDADVSGDGNIEIDNTGGTAISADIVGNGNIDIDNSSGAATTASSLTVGGTGYILFDQSGGGALEVTLATTQAGNIGIDVAGASLTATQVHATDGSVDFDADGLLTAVDVQANDSASTGDYDVTLDTTAGGMDLQFVQADHDIIAEALAGNIEVDSLIAGNQISLTANTVSGQKITDDDDN